MARQSLYPPSPVEVPEDLTLPSSDYKFQISLVLFALALFFLLYFAIMGLSLLVIILTVLSLFSRNAPAAFYIVGIILTLPCAMLFVYMLKNLFKWEKAEKTYDIEIFEDEHPKLFDFIQRLCDEVGSPFPKRVFVNYEVNAAAFQDIGLIHLFIPSHKYLKIGLGLVNTINLTEFKALLAHEFGHFSQKSMKLNGYVYTALRIVEDMVYGRDIFDRFIEGWCRIDPRLAWPAYIFAGILWVLRKLLSGLHYAIFFFDRGRRRQMEFNADLVAVSVCGSDAPCHLLYRCGFSEMCLDQAIRDMQTAMDHHLYTSDMFYHQAHAATFIRRREKKPQLGEPPAAPENEDGAVYLFEPDDDEQAAMWSTHPSNYDREENSKAHYIHSPSDARSPWLLFENVQDLRERVTYKFYRFHFKVPKDVILADPEEIQSFIEEERAETTYDPKFQGLYDYRNLIVGDIYELAQECRKTPWSIGQLTQNHATLYNVEVKHRAQLHNKRLEEYNLLLAVTRGWHKPKNDELEFRGEVYDAKDAKRLMKKVDKELELDHEWLGELDRKVFATFFQMALHVNQGVAEDLFMRYRFHVELQKVWKDLKAQEAPVNAAINFLQNQKSSQLQTHHFQEALGIFREAHHALRDALRATEEMTIPALKNMPAGQPLRPFLLQKKLVEGLSKYEQSLNWKWISKLIDQMRQIQKKVDRVHFKSLGGILALQQRVGQECLKRWDSLPTVTPASIQAPPPL